MIIGVKYPTVTDKKQQTIDAYNRSASELADKFNSLGARSADIKTGLSYVKNNPKVLEIGCANGRDAKEILKYTSDYLGLDISEELINIAKQNVPEGRFKVSDIENYAFPENIDAIFAFASLLHSNIENLQNILNKAHSSLNKGGIFFISLKHGAYQEVIKNDEFGTRTYYFYTPEDIRRLVEGKYNIVKEGINSIRGQDWLDMILQKI